MPFKVLNYLKKGISWEYCILVLFGGGGLETAMGGTMIMG